MPKPVDRELPETEVTPDPLVEKRARRAFTPEYKLRIIAEADRCEHGEIGALLRRENLYSNQLQTWRKLLAEGDPDKVKEIYKDNDWNEFVIRCEGNRIQIWLNGLQTVDFTEKEDVAKTGIIGLQIHGGKPAEASYRDIRIKELKK